MIFIFLCIKNFKLNSLLKKENQNLIRYLKTPPLLDSIGMYCYKKLNEETKNDKRNAEEQVHTKITATKGKLSPQDRF